MGEIITPGTKPKAFLKHAMKHGYGMENSLFSPRVGARIVQEIESAGLLNDKVELEPTLTFYEQEKGMHFARLLHSTLTRLVCKVDPGDNDPLPYFSVRVFEPGMHATTIHRNHRTIGPWAIGNTLRGEAPFNVYDQDVLPLVPSDRVIALMGDGQDPEPRASMNATAGSAWALNTANERLPHSGGFVNSEMSRVMLLFYKN